jgi:hypothetical protein
MKQEEKNCIKKCIMTVEARHDAKVQRKLRKLASGSTMYLIVQNKGPIRGEYNSGHSEAMRVVNTIRSFFPESRMTSGSMHGGFNITVVLQPIADPKPAPVKAAKKLTFRFTRKRALELGLLTCGNCGWPENNHFSFAAAGHPIGDHGKGPCAHDNTCKSYREVQRG